jgi:hypothetical protein
MSVARSSCMHAVYLEGKSLLWRVVICEACKSRTSRFEKQEKSRSAKNWENLIAKQQRSLEPQYCLLMVIPVGQEQSELKMHKVALLVHAKPLLSADEITAAGISHGTCHKILSDHLNMSCVTQRAPCSTCRDTRPT